MQVLYHLWLSNGKKVLVTLALVYPDPICKMQKTDTCSPSDGHMQESAAKYQWTLVSRGKSDLALLLMACIMQAQLLQIQEETLYPVPVLNRRCV